MMDYLADFQCRKIGTGTLIAALLLSLPVVNAMAPNNDPEHHVEVKVSKPIAREQVEKLVVQYGQRMGWEVKFERQGELIGRMVQKGKKVLSFEIATITMPDDYVLSDAGKLPPSQYPPITGLALKIVS